MTPRLHAELQRLYLPDGAPADAPEAPPDAWVDAQGRVRALVLAVAVEAGWLPLAAVWQGVQDEFGLPAPAIAVDGRAGLQLWFSLARPVPRARGRALLQALRRHYLDALPAHRVAQWPAATDAPDDAAGIDHLPPRPTGGERWSAFVSPDLAPVFADTPWLDIPPADDAQAGLLGRLQPMAAAAWATACARLGVGAEAEGPSATGDGQDSRHAPGTGPEPDQGPGEATATGAVAAGPTVDDDALAARRFLRTVMADESAPWSARIEAAKALLSAAAPR